MVNLEKTVVHEGHEEKPRKTNSSSQNCCNLLGESFVTCYLVNIRALRGYELPFLGLTVLGKTL